MASPLIATALISLTILGAPCQASFLGCFDMSEDSHGVRHAAHRHLHRVANWTTMTNADCEATCRDYPLAVTRGDHCDCHSSGILTGARPLDEKLCDKACSGSVTWPGTCVGDECCGGESPSVYTVNTAGGPDWAHVILHRLHHALKTRKIPEISDSSALYKPVPGPAGNGSTHHTATDYDADNDLMTHEGCEKKCSEKAGCRSIYFHDMMGCFLYNVSSNVGILDQDDKYMVHDKLDARIANRVFHMKLTHFSVVANRVTATSTHPLDNKVYELDLRKSNERNDLTRKISVKHLDHYDLRTLSGLNAHNTAGGEATNQPAECTSVLADPRVQLQTPDNPIQVLSHHSLAPLSLQFREELSLALNGAIQSDSPSDSQLSDEKTMMHKDYKSRFLNTTTETYSVSMKVPAFHRGQLSFSLTEEKREFLWKASLQLSDYIEVCHGGELHSIHVSRLLPNEHRKFEVLGQVFYTQHTITSKIEIWDHNGVLVQP